MRCRICGNEADNRLIECREMMYGTRESFQYGECSDCGTVQICRIPEDLARHYQNSYYSFAQPKLKRRGGWGVIRRLRARHYLGHRTLLGALLAQRAARRQVFFPWLRPAGIDLHTAILDVGSGNGALLGKMYNYGFHDLTGIDPFIERDLVFDSGFRVLRKELADERRKFGLVMLHHSFEHMAQPQSVLRQCRELLEPGGVLLIRIPLADSYAWRHYASDWVQLDPPRHLHLFTRRSLAAIAAEARLRVREVIYDSNEIQFWGSEQYRRDIPLHDPRSYGIDPGHSIFTSDELQEFTRHAARLNAQAQGDQACFYLEALPAS